MDIDSSLINVAISSNRSNFNYKWLKTLDTISSDILLRLMIEAVVSFNTCCRYITYIYGYVPCKYAEMFDKCMEWFYADMWRWSIQMCGDGPYRCV